MMVILGLNPAQNDLCDCDVHLKDIISTFFLFRYRPWMWVVIAVFVILSSWCMCVPGKSCSGFVEVWQSFICFVHGDVPCSKHVQSAYIGMAFWLWSVSTDWLIGQFGLIMVDWVSLGWSWLQGLLPLLLSLMCAKNVLLWS